MFYIDEGNKIRFDKDFALKKEFFIKICCFNRFGMSVCHEFEFEMNSLRMGSPKDPYYGHKFPIAVFIFSLF